jgi:hypothetical protein
VIGISEQEDLIGTITKLKWKHGDLYALLFIDSQKLGSWQPIKDFPINVINKVTSHGLRTIGSLKKYKKLLNLKSDE